MDKLSGAATQNLLSNTSYFTQQKTQKRGSLSPIDSIIKQGQKPQTMLPQNRSDTLYQEHPTEVPHRVGDHPIPRSKSPKFAFFNTVLARFRRSVPKDGNRQEVMNDREEVNKLRGELAAANFRISELEKRFTYIGSSADSCQSDTRSLQQGGAERTQSTREPSQDAEFKFETTTAVTRVINYQETTVSQEVVVHRQSRSMMQDENENSVLVKDMQPDTTPMDVRETSTPSTLLDPPTDEEVSLHPVAQSSQVDLDRLPRKKLQANIQQENKEVENRPPGVQEKMPRKKVEVGSDAQPSHSTHDRLPRKKAYHDEEEDSGHSH